MDSLKCRQCNQPVQSTDKFCPHCGAPQEQAPVGTKKCTKCGADIPQSASFCEKCGAQLSGAAASDKARKDEPNTIVSQGNYSGTMTKSKSKFWKRLLYGILIAVVIIAIALVVWFQVDPDAGEKLKTIGGGLLVVVIFLYMVIKGNKKGRRRRGRRSYDDDDWDNDDYDYDDGGDDGGDD